MNDDLILIVLYQGGAARPSVLFTPGCPPERIHLFAQAGWRCDGGDGTEGGADLVYFDTPPDAGVLAEIAERENAPQALKINIVDEGGAEAGLAAIEAVRSAGYSVLLCRYVAEDQQGIWHAASMEPVTRPGVELEGPATVFAFRDEAMALWALRLGSLYVNGERRLAAVTAQKQARDAYIADLEAAAVTLQDSGGRFSLGPATAPEEGPVP